MSSTAAGWLQSALLVLALAVSYGPLGDYMAHILTTPSTGGSSGASTSSAGSTPTRTGGGASTCAPLLAFSLVAVLFLYLIQRMQHHLLLSLGMADVTPATAWNTAASFVTNTNWQNYGGEIDHVLPLADGRAHGAALRVRRRSASRWRSR